MTKALYFPFWEYANSTIRQLSRTEVLIFMIARIVAYVNTDAKTMNRILAMIHSHDAIVMSSTTGWHESMEDCLGEEYIGEG